MSGRQTPAAFGLVSFAPRTEFFKGSQCGALKCCQSSESKMSPVVLPIFYMCNSLFYCLRVWRWIAFSAPARFSRNSAPLRLIFPAPLLNQILGVTLPALGIQGGGGGRPLLKMDSTAEAIFSKKENLPYKSCFSRLHAGPPRAAEASVCV